MTYDLFWNDRPELVKAYREAFEINNKKRNQELWMQGIYFQAAIGSTVGNMFSKSAKNKYPDAPLPITMEDMKKERERKAKEKFERIRKNMELASQKINR